MEPGDIICKVLHNDQEKIETFLNLINMEDKVENIYYSESMQNIFKYEQQKTSQKSEVESSKLREEGNVLIKESNYKAATSKFSAAAIVAPFNKRGVSNSFSLAVANRSFSLLKLGDHESAIEDIDLAIEAGYPEEKRYKLVERKAKCLVNIGRKKKAEETLNLALKSLEFSKCQEDEKLKIRQNIKNQIKQVKSVNNVQSSDDKLTRNEMDDSNPLLPGFSSAVKVVHDDVRGRYGVATRDIEPGTFILEEKPVAAILKEQHKTTHCDHCLSRLSSLLVPCRSCTDVLYCSATCRDIAAGSYHPHECCVQDNFQNISKQFNEGRDLGYTHHRLCYRIITQHTLEYYRNNHENLTRSNTKSGVEGGVFIPGGYQSMADLVSHSDRMDHHTLLPLLLSATLQIRMLQETKYFTAKQDKDCFTEDERILCKIIVHFLQVMKFNTHGIVESVLQEPRRPLLIDVRSIGCGVFPTLCLLNTSCDQNITKYNEGSKVVGMAAKPIKKGEEISDNYFPSAPFMEKTERRKWLKEHYWFQCECNACEESLPEIKDMPDTPTLFICEKCEKKYLSREVNSCDSCGHLFDYNETIKKIHEIRDRISNTVNIYSSSSRADATELTEVLKRDYTNLRNIVAHPYKFLIVAEQQYLKSIKQVFGNHVFRKN